MTPADFMAKAERALSSARILLDAGDTDGACNRVYYAAFDAAKAALIQMDAVPETTIARTHSGLIAAFGLHIVKRGLIGADQGRALNRMHELRMIADYRGGQVDESQVRQAIADASSFVTSIAALIRMGSQSFSR